MTSSLRERERERDREREREKEREYLHKEGTRVREHTLLQLSLPLKRVVSVHFCLIRVTGPDAMKGWGGCAEEGVREHGSEGGRESEERSKRVGCEGVLT